MAFRNKRGRAAITAAARHVDLSRTAKRRNRIEWQTDAYAAFNDVPEVKELFLWRSDQLGKLKLFVAVRLSNDDRDEPVPIDSEAVQEAGLGVTQGVIDLCQAELATLRTAVGGQSEILRRMDLNCEIAGELWLIGFDSLNPLAEAEWVVASISEVEVIAGIRYYSDTPEGLRDPESRREIRNGLDECIRIWQPHAEFYGRADCALRASLTEAELLAALTNQLLAEARGRAGAGFLTIPNELAVQLPGGAPIFSQPQAEGEERKQVDPFMAALMASQMEPAADPTHPSAVVPTAIRGPGELLTPDKLRWFGSGRVFDPGMDARIEGRVRRLARGLSAPPEKIMGFDATTFANADQVDEDTWSDYLQPRADFLVQAITVGFFLARPAILTLPPELQSRLCVWYNADDLIAQPDISGVNADAAFDRGTISPPAYRRARGFSEDDAASEADRLEWWARSRTVVTVDLAAKILSELFQDEGLPDISEWAVPAPGSPGDGGAAAAVAAFLAAALGRNERRAPIPIEPSQSMTAAVDSRRFTHPEGPGRRLAAIDRDLRTRVSVAANAAMERAIEKAANRLRTKHPDKAAARSLGNREIAYQLGAAAVTAALGEDPWAGSWDGLKESWDSWTSTAATEAIGIVSEVSGGLSAAQESAMGDRLSAASDDAFGWFSDSLSGIADQRLFDPSVATPIIGEFDDTSMVPAGAVRQAVARAGGAAGLDTSRGGAWVTVTADGADPGGLAFGQITRDVMAENGAGIEGYLWEYGPGLRRPFEPHLRLAGVEFINFDDDVLANKEGWPEFAFYIPGDHDGCLCDAVPIIIPAGEGEATVEEPVVRTVQPNELPSGVVDYATPAARKAFGPTIEKLDQLHRVEPGVLRQTTVKKGGKTERLGGHFSPASKGPKPRRSRAESVSEYSDRLRAYWGDKGNPEIVVNDRGDGSSLVSLMHEFGHRTDFIGDVDAHMEGRIRLSTRTSYYSAGDTPAVRAFQQAARETSTIADANVNYSDRKYIEYFRSEHEVWARAYSQWTAEQLGGAELDALRATQEMSTRVINGEKIPIFQWPDHEFARLGPLVEGILRERGLLD